MFEILPLETLPTMFGSTIKMLLQQNEGWNLTSPRQDLHVGHFMVCSNRVGTVGHVTVDSVPETCCSSMS